MRGKRTVKKLVKGLMETKQSAIEERYADMPVTLTVRRVKEIRKLARVIRDRSLEVGSLASVVEIGLNNYLLNAFHVAEQEKKGDA